MAPGPDVLALQKVVQRLPHLCKGWDKPSKVIHHTEVLHIFRWRQLLNGLNFVSNLPTRHAAAPFRVGEHVANQVTYMRISSIRISMPSSPSRLSSIFCWKISGALVMPKGNLLRQYLPNGVINVVSLQLSGCSGICQYPLAASREEKLLYHHSAWLLSHQGSAGCTVVFPFNRLVQFCKINTDPGFGCILFQNWNHVCRHFSRLCHSFYDTIVLRSFQFLFYFL